jgi:hypothetical protein
MSISTASGSKFFIGNAGKPTTLVDFQAESWVEVGEIEDLGEVGDESAVVQFASLSDGRMRKLKGVRDAGTQAIVCGADSSDAGQAAMIAAEAQPLDYAMKTELNDPLTLLGSGTILYYYGQVLSKRRNIGNVNNVVRHNFSVGINSPILEVAPT